MPGALIQNAVASILVKLTMNLRAQLEVNVADANLYVLEIRAGIILYFNARTPVADGWWWGTDDTFVRGPFMSYQSAVPDVRRHHDKELNLIVWDKNNFALAKDPSPSGNLIVVNTEGRLWVRCGEILTQ
jgi:hypothetical protein